MYHLNSFNLLFYNTLTWKYIKIIYFVYTYVYVRMCAHMPWHVCGDQKTMQESFLPFHHVGPRDWTRVVNSGNSAFTCWSISSSLLLFNNS